MCAIQDRNNNPNNNKATIENERPEVSAAAVSPDVKHGTTTEVKADDPPVQTDKRFKPIIEEEGSNRINIDHPVTTTNPAVIDLCNSPTNDHDDDSNINIDNSSVITSGNDNGNTTTSSNNQSSFSSSSSSMISISFQRKNRNIMKLINPKSNKKFKYLLNDMKLDDSQLKTNVFTLGPIRKKKLSNGTIIRNYSNDRIGQNINETIISNLTIESICFSSSSAPRT